MSSPSKTHIRIIFMGKNKKSVLCALKYLVDLGIEVVAVVLSNKDRNSKIEYFAKNLRLFVCSDIDIYEHLTEIKTLDFNLKNIDLVISYLFPKKIKKPLINLAKIGCINFHSAPLPEYRGWGVYNAAILNKEQRWGVSAHFVDENFDTGDIIKVNHFNIDPNKETAFSLEQRSQKFLFKLFDEIISAVICDEKLPRKRQEQKAGKMYSKQETLKHEIIKINDSSDVIDTKIRAFWYPPFAAKIMLNKKEYFLISPEIMDDLAKRYVDL